MTDLLKLQKILSVRFNNTSILQQALIHSSYSNENPNTATLPNERLEFLGDAVLDIIISESLYRLLPDSTEGELTRLRSTLVCRGTLARMAKTLGLSQYIYLGRGEEVSGGRDKPSNLAGALEAVIAAIFLDNGYREAKDFILHLFDTELKESTEKQVDIDYKSQLQQIIQSKHHETPIYRTTQTFGSSHNPMFTAEVSLGDILLGRGYGPSKKIAETEAAQSALEQLD